MNQKSALLTVSFGTCYQETQKSALEAIEQELSEAFPQKKSYRAWTSTGMIAGIRKTQNLHIDTVQESLERMLKDDITDVLIQPTHMLAGKEFAALKAIVQAYQDRFSGIKIGTPLLNDSEDVKILAEVLEEIFRDIPDSEMLVFMGHGSINLQFPAYALLESQFRKDGYINFCVGTLESDPDFDAVLHQVRTQKPDRITLFPILVTAGNHVFHDMAGNHPESWKSMLNRAGFETGCILKGMGEYQNIRKIYIQHAQNAVSVT